MHRRHLYSICFLAITLHALPTVVFSAVDSEFPGRQIYSYVKYIELSNFYWNIETYAIVDVRSKYEFETLRIKGAINVPLASRHFIPSMKKLRKATNKTIIVYCNGKTCMKSYKAVNKCMASNIKDIVAFDAGILDWANAYPEMTILLDETLKHPNQLISKKLYAKHTISPDQFGTMIADGNTIALDIRDGFQREGLAIFSGVEIRVSLDNKRRMDKYINMAKKKKLPLLVFDAAGKQTRWLQYYLEKKQLKNYYFMAGGIRAYYDNLSTY